MIYLVLYVMIFHSYSYVRLPAYIGAARLMRAWTTSQEIQDVYSPSRTTLGRTPYNNIWVLASGN